MILSVSRRTDIPCRYADWFMERIRAGYVLTRNPMNHAQLSRVELSPDVVDCIVFWTKDAANLLPHLPELDRRGYRYYFQFTLTPYGREIEPNLRPKDEIVQTFAALSRRIGRDRVVWRYDPIILNDTLSADDHRRAFAALCARLAPYTDTVTVSFVDSYAKLRSQLIRPIPADAMEELSRQIGAAARRCGLRPVACCEPEELARWGLEQAHCIDGERIARIIGAPLRVRRDPNQRKNCGCCESVDIGAYNTCPNGCVYCYATASADAARRNYASHDPHSPLLTGRVGDAETVRARRAASDRVGQLSLFGGDEPQ